MSDPRDSGARAAHDALLRLMQRRLTSGHASAYLVAAMLAGAVIVLLLLTVLAVALGPATGGLDRDLMASIGARRSMAGQRVARQFTALGNTATLAVLLAWVAAVFWVTRRRFEAVTLIVVFGAGRILNEALKAIFGRARPEILEWGTDVVSASFPSAHAMSATIAYGALAWLVGWIGAGPAIRGLAWLLATLLALGVAGSRIYLGVHYPTDALAGMVAGVVWTAIVLSALPAARYFDQR
jgi:membrane-associated phospholipid phosphatase